MNFFARSLVLLAVAGHIGVSITDASAYGPGGSSGTSGGAAPGPSGSAGASAGAGNGGGGHGGVSGAGVSLPFNSPPFNSAPFYAPVFAQPFAPFSFYSALAPTGACSTGAQLPDVDAFFDPVEGLAAISQQTQNYIEMCQCKTQDCVADLLEDYAKAIEKVAPRLPRAARKVIEKLPKIVHAAAQEARKAPTVKAAVKVLSAAVEVVHKTIALMRAADPDSQIAAARGGDLVENTLKSAATALESADTL